MKHIVAGILAHVDAGKTTLSEDILYLCGNIRKIGRVDNRDSFFDNNELERQRGITIVAKQANIEYKDTFISLIDTPGHVDFSAEMERTLQVLDYAVLVISALSGIDGHTMTLWNLLKRYNIPTFIFINKMDQNGADRENVSAYLKKELSDSCIDISQYKGNNDICEAIACTDEHVMEKYLSTMEIEEKDIARLIKERKLFPVYFGSALKQEGVDRFIDDVDKYTLDSSYGDNFGARVYKINRDETGTRLSFAKITGGSIKVKETIDIDGKEEKINQIRIYNGDKYELVNEVSKGQVCAFTGLEETYAGMGLGFEKDNIKPLLVPLLNYKVDFKDSDYNKVINALKVIEDENPELHINWNEELKEMQLQMMGEIQLEIIKDTLKSRFGLNIDFDEGGIVYKETISNSVIGVGHFEPLKHYAEVMLLIEAGQRGSGIVFSNQCSDDNLDKNWQSQIMNHLANKEHKGVLTGSALTDVKITLLNGKSHIKHTESGDFRQACYRAVREGLMEAESMLLEPYYMFTIKLPQDCVGRAMTDIEQAFGTCKISDKVPEEGYMLIEGRAPVSTIANYKTSLTSYTKGKGRITYEYCGYDACHNEEEVICNMAYNPDADLRNPASSVFCSHGAGYLVEWFMVKQHMHMSLHEDNSEKANEAYIIKQSQELQNKIDLALGTEEIDDIINRTMYANSSSDSKNKYKKVDNSYSGNYKSFGKAVKKNHINKEKYLLVDGYNIIFSWDELNDISKDNLDGARGRLLDIMSNYKAMTGYELMVIFDAYRVKGRGETVQTFNNITVVYTKESQTADSYIENFAHKNADKYDITVATSDGLEQIIIRGEGCNLMSSRDLLEDVNRRSEQLREKFNVESE
ncbi:MAG: NYN domain-containing protein [Lachnospiraceae bacterium]|nr:NYN domain-containing protein [Lachnospiraceae bacterium]